MALLPMFTRFQVSIFGNFISDASQLQNRFTNSPANMLNLLEIEDGGKVITNNSKSRWKNGDREMEIENWVEDREGEVEDERFLLIEFAFPNLLFD
ncbi:hypothetical protein L6452_32909 [Arctium lappa]|uniref:Uncharacterized protein n=1 Tax=Arctium lappa TaxID=4217 RepID=A0ACB8Z5U6_ARCLA|nr:hypothetical protein L6452_32909 [Arctium lappa]